MGREKVMARYEQDMENFANMLIHTADAIRYYLRVKSYDDCNNCGSKNVCKYAPKAGEMVRINCPLWTSKQTDCAWK